MTFTSALIVERSSQGSRASVKEQGKDERAQSESVKSLSFANLISV